MFTGLEGMSAPPPEGMSAKEYNRAILAGNAMLAEFALAGLQRALDRFSDNTIDPPRRIPPHDRWNP